MKRSLINILIFVVFLTGMLIAGVQIGKAAIGSSVWTVNCNDIDPNEPGPEAVWTVNYNDIDPNEPEPGPETVLR